MRSLRVGILVLLGTVPPAFGGPQKPAPMQNASRNEMTSYELRATYLGHQVGTLITRTTGNNPLAILKNMRHLLVSLDELRMREPKTISQQ